jgi:hypothetical protein
LQWLPEKVYVALKAAVAGPDWGERVNEAEAAATAMAGARATTAKKAAAVMERARVTKVPRIVPRIVLGSLHEAAFWGEVSSRPGMAPTFRGARI